VRAAISKLLAQSAPTWRKGKKAVKPITKLTTWNSETASAGSLSCLQSYKHLLIGCYCLGDWNGVIFETSSSEHVRNAVTIEMGGAERSFQSSWEWGKPPVIDFKGLFVLSVTHGSCDYFSRSGHI
jgi:hypothetical protein